MPATVRISDSGRSLLGELATQTHCSTTEILDAALELYRRHRFLQQASEAYAELAKSADASSSFQSEIAELDACASW